MGIVHLGWGLSVGGVAGLLGALAVLGVHQAVRAANPQAGEGRR
jgi:hypothetical protein